MVFLLSLVGVLEMNDSIRKRLEEKEENLSIFASKVVNSKGRNVFEEPSPFRTDFQRDRDRIVHSKSFRRIKHKTQVFISPLGDHFVTRLTHTLEVSQIARTISRALNLNEDLTEAMSLGHDVGHTPFGHLGEELLSQLSGENFRHNHQSLRLVEKIEKEGKWDEFREPEELSAYIQNVFEVPWMVINYGVRIDMVHYNTQIWADTLGAFSPGRPWFYSDLNDNDVWERSDKS